jgi:hypothetical protein
MQRSKQHVTVKKPDYRNRRLLRAGRERPSYRCATDRFDEIPPSHVALL